MSDAPSDAEVCVEAPARLHFGVLDLRGSLGRSFGGIGAAAPAPSLLLSAVRARAVHATGADARRAAEFARRFLAFHGLEGAGVRLHVHRALPAHAGLGSGTQLALAVGRATAELYGVPADAPSLARAVGRTRRSAVGTWTFADGGLVVEGGRRADPDAPAPLLARLPFPPEWRCVVAVPAGSAGASGAGEAAALASLPTPPEREVERVAHLVLMALLPALVEADLAGFGWALSEIQRVTGAWWAPAQGGGAFAAGPGAGLVRQMAAWGAPGVGQSSWGPTVYAVVDGDAAAGELAARVRAELGGTGAVYSGAFQTTGARVWRGVNARAASALRRGRPGLG